MNDQILLAHTFNIQDEHTEYESAEIDTYSERFGHSTKEVSGMYIYSSTIIIEARIQAFGADPKENKEYFEFLLDDMKYPDTEFNKIYNSLPDGYKFEYEIVKYEQIKQETGKYYISLSVNCYGTKDAVDERDGEPND